MPNKASATERHLSDREIAERWGCSPTLVRRARYSGRHLPMTRLGGMARVAPSAVVAYEQARTTGVEA